MLLPLPCPPPYPPPWTSPWPLALLLRSSPGGFASSAQSVATQPLRPSISMLTDSDLVTPPPSRIPEGSSAGSCNVPTGLVGPAHFVCGLGVSVASDWSTCRFGVTVVDALTRSTFFVVAGMRPLAGFSTLNVDSRCLLMAPCHSMDLPAWTFILRHPRRLRYRHFVVQDLPELVAHSGLTSSLERRAREGFWWVGRLVLWTCGPGACRVWVRGVRGLVVSLPTRHMGFWAAHAGCEAHAGSHRCGFVSSSSHGSPLTLSTLFLNSATFCAVSRLVTTPGKLFFDFD